MKTLRNIFFILIMPAGFISCKDAWLEAKPSKSIIAPESLSDYQAVLDNSGIMNSNYPNIGEICADNYYVSETDYQAGSTTERNAYIWQEDLYEGATLNEWNFAYRRILYANIVLEGLQKIIKTPINGAQRDNLEGAALFFRSLEYYNLAQQFVRPYNAASAEADPGLPLRLNTAIMENVPRSTLQQTYVQLFSDLKRASLLLPESQTYKTRPSRAAAFSLLARAYLTVEDYAQALAYADSALAISGDLLDYNTLDLNTTFKIPLLNNEVIFQASVSTSTLLELTRKTVDSVLYASYDENDLRKKVFFYDLGGKKIFTGSYLNGEYNLFGGIAADEIYLVRAECLARTGKGAQAMETLNSLLSMRWARGKFSPLRAVDDRQALRLVLAERRKELLFRNLRWQDLRRLNKDSDLAVTLKRNINGRTYTLSPGSERYTLPIPPDEILLSGISQN